MKKLLFILMSFIGLNASAQDVIVKRNGDEFQCKILEVSKNEVKYKRWSNQEGPTFTEKKADIFMLKYENGEKEVLTYEQSAAQPQNTSILVPNEIQVAEPTPISKRYLEYTSRGFRLGIKKWGNRLSKEQSKLLLQKDWTDYRESVRDERVGKILAFSGGTIFVGATGCTVIHNIKKSESIVRKGTGWGMAGGFTSGSALLLVGIIKAKRGHKNATQIVSKYNDEYEKDSKKSSMSKPEFNVNSKGNNLAFTLTF